MTEEKTTSRKDKISIAICGTRGIPACYGGFETFAEQVSSRLVQKGCSVRVYGRSHVIDYKEKFYNGVEIMLLPAPKHKYLETIIHSILSFIHLLYKPVDVALVCNAANSPFVWLLKLRGIKILINVDGIERKRSKWNRFGKLWYKLGESCSKLFADIVISDAEVIREYYKEEHNIDSEVITYGYNLSDDDLVEERFQGGSQNYDLKYGKVLKEFGLDRDNYFLYVSRLEPENNAHTVIDAYIESGISRPLVIVGDAPYSKEYIQSLKIQAKACISGKIVFTGFQFNEAYKAFQLGAYAYIQATEVGGTHPALVEAMGYGNAIIVNGTPENKEVLGDAGLVYKINSVKLLASCIIAFDESLEACKVHRHKARARALKIYNWEKVSSLYVGLFKRVIAE